MAHIFEELSNAEQEVKEKKLLKHPSMAYKHDNECFYLTMMMNLKNAAQSRYQLS